MVAGQGLGVEFELPAKFPITRPPGSCFLIHDHKAACGTVHSRHPDQDTTTIRKKLLLGVGVGAPRTLL